MNTGKGKMLLRLVLLAGAVILIAAGIAVKDPAAVWTKAVKICLECIGLG